MANREYRRFYFLSLATLLCLSAYPLVNGARMAHLSLANGALEPEQYAKYVVPYTAICVSVLLFAALQPLLFKLKRFSFWSGVLAVLGSFVGVELFFERMQLHTVGMTLIDAASLTTEAAPSATVDTWQASLCITSPLLHDQTVTYASQDRFFYVLGNDTYKIHYYLISLLMIAMICGLVYGLGRMYRTGDRTGAKPLMLRGVSTAALVALCVFANTTAFFRQAEAIQTPSASLLTCLFFVTLGTAVGVYAGSFLLQRGKAVPVLIAIGVTACMYAGEAVMMQGGLYRFGTGWFFEGLPNVVLAPADILVVALSGAVTWAVLAVARAKADWPGKRTVAGALAVCMAVALAGLAFGVAAPALGMGQPDDDDIFDSYVVKDCLYMNPLSSFAPVYSETEGRVINMPYIYDVRADHLIIANTATGDMETLSAEYCKSPVGSDELTSKIDFLMPFALPDLSQYKERWLRAVFSSGVGQQYGLYQMDDEIWLVQLGNGHLWSVYRMERTTQISPADLERALAFQGNKPPAYGDPPQEHAENRMTMEDVYALARRGDALTLRDFEHFDGRLVGPDFTSMQYLVDWGCVVYIRSDAPDAPPEYIRLSKRGCDPLDPALTVDLRAGFDQVAAYLDPLHSLGGLTVEEKTGFSGGSDRLYEFDGYQYRLNRSADPVFVVFEDGERMPVKRALEERRIIIEDAVAAGLSNVSMTPVDNPMGGMFPILHHSHIFTLDGEAFYPSLSFLYVDGLTAYFDVEELRDFLVWYGKSDTADKLRHSGDATVVINGKAYLNQGALSKAGLTVGIGWELSSHTPVWFETDSD